MNTAASNPTPQSTASQGLFEGLPLELACRSYHNYLDTFQIDLPLSLAFLNRVLAEPGGALPPAAMVGADLRIYGRRVYQWEAQQDAPDDLPPYDGPVVCDDGELVVLPDALGRRTDSIAAYVATAVEAEKFARDIKAATGTTFHPLSRDSLLDPDVFAPMASVRAVLPPPTTTAFFSR